MAQTQARYVDRSSHVHPVPSRILSGEVMNDQWVAALAGLMAGVLITTCVVLWVLVAKGGIVVLT